MNSVQLGELLDVQQRTAWYMGHRIRNACRQVPFVSGQVQGDEAYFGGKEANKHASKKARAGRGAVSKTAVFGMKDDKGRVYAQVVNDTTKDTLQGIIQAKALIDSVIITDEHRSYLGVRKKGYLHVSVNHSKGEYVRGGFHTNGIESFWAVLKRAIAGNFYHLSDKHLQRYVDEFAFRASNGDFFQAVCKNMQFGARLKYKNLVGVGVKNG